MDTFDPLLGDPNSVSTNKTVKDLLNETNTIQFVRDWSNRKMQGTQHSKRLNILTIRHVLKATLHFILHEFDTTHKGFVRILICE